MPSHIGRFAVLEPLGSGGMGLVCAAYDSELDRKVAIKLLRPQTATGRVALAQARLLREAQAMARLAHPNVVTIHEVGTHGDQVFIAMEFLRGVTLKRWLRRARRPWREVLPVFLQAGRGLAAAHAAGLIHRDFKPDNVMVAEDPRTGLLDRVRVFDFGVVQETREAAVRQGPPTMPPRSNTLEVRRMPTPEPEPRVERSTEDLHAEPLRRARSRSLPGKGEGLTSQESLEATPPSLADSSMPGDEIYTTGLTAAGALVGTPLYMAPEQHDGAADARSDQFSFCAALYEALYRRRPFTGDTVARLQQSKRAGAIRRPPKHNDVPAWLHRVVVRGLASDPGRRYPSMDALLADLGRDSRRQPLMLLAIGAALALVGLGAGLAWSLLRTPEDPCMSVVRSLAPVWSPARRETIQAAFRATGRPYAQATWTTVERSIDAYTDAWIEQRVALCHAASDPHQGHELPVRQLCLEQRREELAALLDLLGRADGEVVDNAVQAVTQLQPVVGCDDPGAHFARAPRLAAALDVEVNVLEQRLAELRALEQTGKYGTGVELAEAVVRDARSLGHAPLIAEALFWQGLLHSRLSATRTAELTLRESALLAEESRHDPIFARAATELVRVIGVEQERYSEGMVWGELAGAALRRVGDVGGEVTRRGYLGHLFQARGELAAAQTAYSDALERALQNFPEEHPAVATALDDLAGMQLARGDHAAAQASYEKVLKIRQATQGPEHPRVAEVLGHLGRVATAQGRQDQAHALFERALEICERLRSCGPVERAGALIDLGRAEQAIGRHAAAQQLEERALGLYEELYGRDHAKNIALLLDLGTLAMHQARHEEASAYYQRALAVQGRVKAGDDPAMARIYVKLGALALARGRHEEARGDLERAFGVFERQAEVGAIDLAQTLDLLGLVAGAQGRKSDAVASHTRARELYRRTLGEAQPEVVRVTLHLAEAQLASGDPRAAEALLTASVHAQEQAGASPVALAPGRFLLARSLTADPRSGDPQRLRARARALAMTALAAEQLAPDHHLQVAEILTWLRALPKR